ncbi:MAG: hypothetical protein K2K81_10225, partial [Muribaculaceae bacterium]|nr:hypothetical protein [Muribaculaceae bacterium]
MDKLVDNDALKTAVRTIREQVDLRISKSREDCAKVDESTQKVIPDQLPVPVVRFNGFYIGLKDPVGQSMGAGDYEILYHRGKNTFVAVRTGVANPDPFSNFPPDI